MKRTIMAGVIIAMVLGLALAAGATIGISSKSITAQNTYSDPIAVVEYFNISLSGTWTGTVTLQRSFDNGSTWRDVATFDENTETIGMEPEAGVLYRFGVKTGEFGSGTIVGRISR